MNVAFFLKPKSEVRFLYSDTPMAQALEFMQRHGYSSVPVIDRDGRYVRTVREGDFLNYLAHTDGNQLRITDAQTAASCRLSDILPDQDRNPPCHISVPVVDDRGIFIGIVTRRVVINYLLHPADLL